MLFNRQSMARRLLSKLQSPLCLLFPEVCHLCGIQVAEPCDGYICRLCAVSMRRLVGPVCQICGLPEEGRSMRGFLCPDCHPDRFAFASARSAVEATPSMLRLGSCLCLCMPRGSESEASISRLYWVVG